MVPTVYRAFDYEAMAREIAADREGLAVLVVLRDPARRRPAACPGRQAPPRTVAEAPIRWLFYTSGTTADPKGAPHTDLAVMASALAMAECLTSGPDDVSASCFPLHPHRGHRLADGRHVDRLPLLTTEAFDPTGHRPSWPRTT